MCKHCNNKSYSSYSYPNDRKVKCATCGKEIINTYYQPEFDSKTELDYVIEAYEKQQNIGKLNHIEIDV
jgi:hypothetical protein